MKLFTLKDKKLKGISNKPFKLEKEIQIIVENNLKELFGLQFVKSELTIKNFRLDTLGYDEENRSFVIIEYKKDRNYSIIDQGYTYLSLMLNNKSDFILEYNENCDKNLKRDDVDWSQSRVVFISPHFTEYQKHSINFKDVPFEIWEIKRFENGLIGFDHHKTTSDESISTTSTNENDVVKRVSNVIKRYDEDYHLDKSKVLQSTKQLYKNLKERILNIGDDIEIIPRKKIIGFNSKKRFFDVYVGKDVLWCWINLKKGELDDPKKFCRDVSTLGHYGNGDYDMKITEDTDLDYIMYLINQSYKSQE